MQKPDKSLIYPLFISMQGCPGRCCYCDQQKISGAADFALPVAVAEAEAFIRRHPHTVKEIALYGGSFTALPILRQIEILGALNYILDAYSSLRISTHPLYIDNEILALLKRFRVDTIELGIQDFSDAVLNASGRGYTMTEALEAISLVQKAGFRLGLQLMPGLPGSNEESLEICLALLKELKPHYLRLYPCIVIAGTPLETEYKEGRYQPLSLDESLEICARYTALCQVIGTKIIKYGLPSNISQEEVVAGPYHPAYGELVKQKILYDKLQARPCLFHELNSKEKQLLTAHGGRQHYARNWDAAPAELRDAT